MSAVVSAIFAQLSRSRRNDGRARPLRRPYHHLPRGPTICSHPAKALPGQAPSDQQLLASGGDLSQSQKSVDVPLRGCRFRRKHRRVHALRKQECNISRVPSGCFIPQSSTCSPHRRSKSNQCRSQPSLPKGCGQAKEERNPDKELQAATDQVLEQPQSSLRSCRTTDSLNVG